jgi:hypothetical protein
MTFWAFLDRRWPSERAWVTIGLVALIWGLLQMSADNPDLWQVELFKTLLTASVVTGALNMVLAFHFTANKSDEKKTDNTAKAFEAITATAHAAGSTDTPDIELHPGETATISAEDR